jgi:hypothetical protein
MVALIGAGCSNAGNGSSGGNENATNRGKAVKFAECMRDNGVREFPNPNASGEFAYGIKRGSALDPSSAAWKKAIGACKDLQPPGALGDGKQSAEEKEAGLKFAGCMRDNGVEDFPDPTENGPLIKVEGARSIPGFQAAAESCLDVYSGELGGQ